MEITLPRLIDLIEFAGLDESNLRFPEGNRGRRSSHMSQHAEVPGALRKLRGAGFRQFTLTDNLLEVQTRQLTNGGIVDSLSAASAVTASSTTSRRARLTAMSRTSSARSRAIFA
jgi:hypothetical protein